MGYVDSGYFSSQIEEMEFIVIHTFQHKVVLLSRTLFHSVTNESHNDSEDIQKYC